jgi:hypothetical protein
VFAKLCSSRSDRMCESCIEESIRSYLISLYVMLMCMDRSDSRFYSIFVPRFKSYSIVKKKKSSVLIFLDYSHWWNNFSTVFG